MKKKTKKSNPNASGVMNDMEKRIDKSKSAVFVWNLYEVGLVGRSEPILVCAPSMTGAIKRAATLVASWEDGDKYELAYVRIIGICVN